jgi:hypothetical protein
LRNVELELSWLERAQGSGWPQAIYYYALYLLEGNPGAFSSQDVFALMSRASDLGCWQATRYLESIPKDGE